MNRILKVTGWTTRDDRILAGVAGLPGCLEEELGCR